MFKFHRTSLVLALAALALAAAPVAAVTRRHASATARHPSAALRVHRPAGSMRLRHAAPVIPDETAATNAAAGSDIPRPVRTAMKVTAGVSRDPYIGAIAFDADTGRVFFSDHADQPGYPASITKLMTMLLVLEDIRAGKYALTDRATASVLASRQEPSSVGIRPGQSMVIDDLLYAIMIKSANDAAVVLAEKAAGGFGTFVARMNAKAAELGMVSTRFSSPNGLPPRPGSKREPDTTTAADLVLLAREIVNHHPEALKYTHEATRTVTDGAGKPLTFTNHNPFLVHRKMLIAGCDGLKTGYTAAAGSSIVLTASRHGRRIIVVVLGSARRELRDEAAARLMADAWGALDCWSPAPAIAHPAPAPAAATSSAAAAEEPVAAGGETAAAPAVAAPSAEAPARNDGLVPVNEAASNAVPSAEALAVPVDLPAVRSEDSAAEAADSEEE